MTGTTSDGRVPPSDLDAEAALLSAVLISEGRLFEIAALVEAGDFYSDSNRQIFRAMLDLHMLGKPIDVLSVRGWLTDHDLIERAGGSTYLAQILDCVPAIADAHVVQYCERVTSKAKMRRLISTMQEHTALAYLHTGDAGEACDAAAAAIGDVNRTRGATEVRPLRYALNAAFDRIKAMHERGATRTGTATGLNRLDRITGGWQSTDLIVIAARPGMGKTAFMMGQALAAARDSEIPSDEHAPNGNAAAVFSLEMPESQLAFRLICQEAMLNLRDVRQGKVGKEGFDKMAVVIQSLWNAGIYCDDTSSPSEVQLHAGVLRMKEACARLGQRLALVCIDYLQLIRCAERASNRDEKIGIITRSLKNTAKAARVPIMVLSQLNRGPEEGAGRRPRLSDLRESGNIEQDADVVGFIHRPKYYEQSRDGKPSEGGAKEEQDIWEGEEAEFIIAKQRNGPTGTVHMRFVRAATRFFPPTNESEDDLFS